MIDLAQFDTKTLLRIMISTRDYIYISKGKLSTTSDIFTFPRRELHPFSLEVKAQIQSILKTRYPDIKMASPSGDSSNKLSVQKYAELRRVLITDYVPEIA